MIAVLRGNVAGDRLAIALLVGLWIYVVVPSALSKIGAPVGGIAEISLVLVTVLAFAIVVVRAASLPRLGIEWVILFLAPCVYVLFRDAYNGVYSTHGVSYAVIALGIAAARPRIEVLRVVGVLTVVAAVLVIGLGVLRPDVAIVRDATGDAFLRDDNKAFFPSIGMLSGIFGTENNLGQFLVLGLPMLYLVRRLWLRLAGAAVIGFAILWSSSRGSLITLVVVVAVLALLTLVRSDGPRVVLGRLAILAAAIVCVALPLLGWPDDAFTSRASIWNHALPIWWQSSPLVGFGTDWFTRQLDSGLSPLIGAAVHGHNQFVHGAVTGGLVGLGLTALQLGVVAWRGTHGPAGSRATRRTVILSSIVLVGILVNCWLEFVLGYVDGVSLWPVTFPVLAVLLFHRDAGAGSNTGWTTPVSGRELRRRVPLRSV